VTRRKREIIRGDLKRNGRTRRRSRPERCGAKNSEVIFACRRAIGEAAHVLLAPAMTATSWCSVLLSLKPPFLITRSRWGSSDPAMVALPAPHRPEARG
jgi:hypothetical protein